MSSEDVALVAFWCATGLLIYTYIGFPIITWLRALILPRPYATGSGTPTVSIIVAAYNEASTIGPRIENLLAQDYPAEAVEVVIASDGSTDATHEIVRRFADVRVRLLELPRKGKVSALNSAAAAATHDILVFTDANTVFAPDALRNLVRPFHDSAVGGVAGDQRYFRSNAKASATEGERGYWNFDRTLKILQSRAGNTISATGAIYAIRRTLFEPICSGTADDFVCSTGVIDRGYRLVFASDAVAYEAIAGTNQVEFGRKVRIMTQGFRSVFARRRLMNPFRHGFYAVQVISHKVLRRLSAFPLIIVAIASPFLWHHGAVYQLATTLQAAFYILALCGLVLRNQRLGHIKVFAYPFFVTMVYVGSLVALVQLMLGRRLDLWQPQRLPCTDSGASTSIAS